MPAERAEVGVEAVVVEVEVVGVAEAVADPQEVCSVARRQLHSLSVGRCLLRNTR